ncbi:MAG: DUF4190 domain-containing protein [Actinomycetota bacterium]|nr:DUF4190 domain-containing protein [Actinomycetota bacterium]
MTRTDEPLLPTYQPGAPTSGTAIAALVMAIASFVVFPIVPAVIALVLSSSAKREIRASGGAVQGRTVAQAATIVAAVNLGLFVFALLVVVVVLVLPTLFM